ncbi:MAG: rhomboid family intramembrane serine protease [Planctomycetaceae bacterium]
MDEVPQGFESVFETTDRAECREYRLVLIAVGIGVAVVRRDPHWLLVVRHRDLEMATAELAAYRQENRESSSELAPAAPLYGGAGTGVLLYSAVIILIANLSVRRAFDLEWFMAGRMQAGTSLFSDWWRPVTALTLHLDAPHLCSNLLFGAVFGFMAGRVLGGGVAWLTIVIAGAMGNFASALLKTPDHISIGASTAVFAALGVIVSNALSPKLNAGETRLKRWSPLIGGILLFSLTGVGGERTDVSAHVTGFLAGLVLGSLERQMPERWRASPSVQRWTGLTALVIVATAWFFALAVRK